MKKNTVGERQNMNVWNWVKIQICQKLICFLSCNSGVNSFPGGSVQMSVSSNGYKCFKLSAREFSLSRHCHTEKSNTQANDEQQTSCSANFKLESNGPQVGILETLFSASVLIGAGVTRSPLTSFARNAARSQSAFGHASIKQDLLLKRPWSGLFGNMASV